MSSQIEFPELLQNLLNGSPFAEQLGTMAKRASKILGRSMPFFPYYTDHGVDHINDVLTTQVALIPEAVWTHKVGSEKRDVLTAADAAVIIGATLLHDIAMFLDTDGFRELIADNTRFKPLAWFSEEQEGHSADRPWHELWADFEREARKMSDSEIATIIGPKAQKQKGAKALHNQTTGSNATSENDTATSTWGYNGLPAGDNWDDHTKLFVGEFLRRHHARLAHEIAIYGFPGLPVGSNANQFPAPEQDSNHDLFDVADLIGLTARSHGMSLRICIEYLKHRHDFDQTSTPGGCAVLYPMALLRVADYLQLDKKRAPAVLLQLRRPQSRISLQEWEKHRVVTKVKSASDPTAIHIQVSPQISHAIYLQIEKLLQGVQSEMDHSTAVLSERYAKEKENGLDMLILKRRRIVSNLLTPKFRKQLPYLPEHTGFSADPHLLTLLVEPLYGKHPSVGVRELMQNAVDAVRELEEWCKKPGRSKEALDLPDLGADVLVEFIRRDDGSWFLRVTDRGIGMRGETLANYFLRAGASFRRSPEWTKEFVGDSGKPTVTRAGQFGIGAFAIFLLGNSFTLKTRHAGSSADEGYSLEASQDSTLIEIRKETGFSVGTVIEVALKADSLEILGLEKLSEGKHLDLLTGQLNWYCGDWPVMQMKVIDAHQHRDLPLRKTLPLQTIADRPEWATLRLNDGATVHWTFDRETCFSLSCNGFRIGKPFTASFRQSEFSQIGWSDDLGLQQPFIDVEESSPNLQLTTQRYALSDTCIRFIDDLEKDVLFSFIAYCLICGPSNQQATMRYDHCHPLQLRSRITRELGVRADRPLEWCATKERFVPADWSLLAHVAIPLPIIVFGVFAESSDFWSRNRAAHLPIFSNELSVVAVATEGYRKAHGLEFDFMIEMLSQMMRGSTRIKDLVISASRDYCDNTFPDWKLCRKSRRGYQLRRHFEIEEPIDCVASVMAEWEKSIARKPFLTGAEINNRPVGWEDLLFVSIIEPNSSQIQESQLTKAWIECLGNEAIWFDMAKRQNLIETGSKHPQLKPHLDAWQKMKAEGSKWATGGFAFTD